MFPKVEELDHPPVIGETYSVLCMKITSDRDGISRFLPILGEGHIDEFDFGFEDTEGKSLVDAGPHGHHDTRFFTKEELKVVNDNGTDSHTFRMKYGPKFVNETDEGIFSYVIRRFDRKMLREFPYAVWKESSERIKLEKKFENHKLDMDCKKCPHQGANLDAVLAVHGKILCPHHNLMWNAEDGSLVRKMQDPSCLHR
jgi:hypothetical protein